MEEISKYVLSAATGTWVINILAWLINGLAGMVGRLIVTLIDAILVPILNYDGFATSKIVDLGWSLVRDSVNMFVVVILLVIAALTIVGSPKANWQQQIPRLFIFTIAVNFSRTLCGIAIDISNVVMFQFVNAILVVGAGNFAELLQIHDFGQFSTFEAVTTGVMQNFATAWIQLALMLAVLGVILIMTIVFLYRIVVLWLLIIMSPMAFFAGGIKDVVGAAGNVYSQWMSKFTAALFLGPVLTFFLWLALAASSGGSIITNENFPVGQTTEGFGLMLKVLEMSNLTSLLLGLILLVVGMQLAGTFASQLGGFAGNLINGGMGEKLAKGALMLPARGFGKAGKAGVGGLAWGGREIGRQADRYVGLDLDKRLGTNKGSLLSHIGGDVIKSGESMRGNGLWGSVAGRVITAGGDKILKRGEGLTGEARKKAEERTKDWSSDRKASEQRVAFERMKKNQNYARWSSGDDQDFVIAELATIRSAQKKFEDEIKTVTKASQKAAASGNTVLAKSLSDQAEALQKKFDEGMRTSIEYVEANKARFLTDDSKKKFFAATKSTYADLSPDIVDHIDSEDFTARIMRASALAAGAKGDQIQEALQNKTVRTANDGTKITMWDEMLKGVYGKELETAAGLRRTAPKDRTLITNADVNRPLPSAPSGGAIGPSGPPLSQADIAANIAAKNIDVATLTAANFDASNPNRDNLIKAIVQVGSSPRDIADPTGAARDAYTARLTELANAGELSAMERAKVDRYNLENAVTGHNAPGHATAKEVFKDPAGPGGYDISRIVNALDQSAITLRHLTDAVNTAGPDGDKVSAAVTGALSAQNIRDLGKTYAEATGDMRDQITGALTNAITALSKTMKQSAPPPGTSWKKHDAALNEKYDQLASVAARAKLTIPAKP